MSEGIPNHVDIAKKYLLTIRNTSSFPKVYAVLSFENSFSIVIFT